VNGGADAVPVRIALLFLMFIVYSSISVAARETGLYRSGEGPLECLGA